MNTNKFYKQIERRRGAEEALAYMLDDLEKDRDFFSAAINELRVAAREIEKMFTGEEIDGAPEYCAEGISRAERLNRAITALGALEL